MMTEWIWVTSDRSWQCRAWRLTWQNGDRSSSSIDPGSPEVQHLASRLRQITYSIKCHCLELECIQVDLHLLACLKRALVIFYAEATCHRCSCFLYRVVFVCVFSANFRVEIAQQYEVILIGNSLQTFVQVLVESFLLSVTAIQCYSDGMMSMIRRNAFRGKSGSYLNSNDLIANLILWIISSF